MSKGVSEVIGALIVLIIVVVLGGLAYTFITGSTTRQLSTAVSVDPALTTCSGTTITIGVKNAGSDNIAANTISVSGTKPDGTAILWGLATSALCTNAFSAGLSTTCTTALATTGAAGTNKITLTVGRTTATGVVGC